VGPHAHEDDRIALRAVLEETSVAERVRFVDGDYDCRQVKALYQFMDFMVCTRFHSAIFSVAQNVPCVAVSYQGYKAPGIMQEIGLQDYCLSIETVNAESLIEAYEKLVAAREEVKQKMKIYMDACRQRLADLQHLVDQEIGDASVDGSQTRPAP
jgi:colanic acid/amylovoran biosynthesis protein